MRVIGGAVGVINAELWPRVLINHLYKQGVRHFCLAPGSRSAPLTLAVNELQKRQPEVKVHCHFDERGLGFFALGISKKAWLKEQVKEPVVLITTSGTAVVNLHPAVVEAAQTQLPLILLTADRPDELLNCGANQAIAQKSVFAQHTLAELNIPPWDERAQANEDFVLKNLAAINAALRKARHPQQSGPVQINCQFRDPLYPSSENAWPDTESHIELPLQANQLDLPEGHHRSQLNLKITPNTLIVAGALTQPESQKVMALVEATGCKVYPDVNSQLRSRQHPLVISYGDLKLAKEETLTGEFPENHIDQVIQMGGRLVSKRMNQWLSRCRQPYHLIDQHLARLDPTGMAQQWCLPIAEACDQLLSNTNARGQIVPEESKENFELQLAERAELKPWSELTATMHLLKRARQKDELFIGNSLAIRFADSLCPLTDESPLVISQRGASGIDGLVASACGSWSQPGSGRRFLLLGDTSLLHDLNSLALLSHSPSPVTLVVLNNDGGSIFNLLPAKQFSQARRDYFQVPHGMTFEAIAKQFGLNYYQPHSVDEYDFALESCSQAHSLIECLFDSQQATDLLTQLIHSLAKESGYD